MKLKKILIKSLAWRVYSFFLALFLLYFGIGELERAIMITIVIEFIKTLSYILFEILWGRKYGKSDGS